MTNDDESEHPPTGSVIGLQVVGVESLEQEATVEATEKTSQPSDGFSMLFSVRSCALLFWRPTSENL